MAVKNEVTTLREKTTEELYEMWRDAKRELMNLRFQRRLTEFKQTHRFGQIRKMLARIVTILTERQRGVAS